jgi:hypothetical protein
MVEATCAVAGRESRIGVLQRLDLIINLKTAKALGLDIQSADHARPRRRGHRTATLFAAFAHSRFWH